MRWSDFHFGLKMLLLLLVLRHFFAQLNGKGKESRGLRWKLGNSKWSIWSTAQIHQFQLKLITNMVNSKNGNCYKRQPPGIEGKERVRLTKKKLDDKNIARSKSHSIFFLVLARSHTMVWCKHNEKYVRLMLYDFNIIRSLGIGTA